MKLFLLTAIVVFLAFAVILVKSEKDADNSGSILDSGRNLLNSGRNESMGLFERFRHRISSRISRTRNRLQNHYERHAERLQRRAVDSLDRLSAYVERRFRPESREDTEVKAVQQILDDLSAMRNKLKNLFASRTKDVDREEELEPKIGENLS